MKKILLIAGVLVCMLLTACKGEGEKEPENLDPVSEVLLYDENGIQVKIQASTSLELNGKLYVLYVVNNTDEERDLNFENWLINDKIVLGEAEWFSLEPNESQSTILSELTDSLYLEGEGLQSLSCHLEIEDEEYEIVDERELTMHLETPMVSDILFNPFMGAKAEKQVLVDDEQVKVTLIGWGRSPDDDYYVRGLLYFENKSEQCIPVMVNAISINGIFLRTSGSVVFLNPGESCYGKSSLLKSDFEDAGIDSISELQIMILTDESQNTGTVNYSGGKLYPVELSEKSESTDVFETGEVLLNEHDIEVSLVSQELTEWSFGGGYYKWKFAVINNSDENIEVAAINVLLDGIPEEEWSGDDMSNSFYIAENEVGAGSRRYVDFTLSFKELILQPELRFQFQIRSMAGGSVIYTGTEEITIAPDAQ